MSKRTREQETAYRRDLRARKKTAAAVPPGRKSHVPPVVCPPENVPPVPLAVPPTPCPDCAAAQAEIARLNTIIVQQAAEIAVLKGSTHGKTALTVSRPEAEAQIARVVAAKIDRINSYSRGHVIGTART